MRSEEVSEAIKMLGNIKLKVIYDLTGDEKRCFDKVLNYIEELEQLPNKIRANIKELEEDKQTILQAIEEAKESKDEEFLKYNREILYRINGEISVLKSIIGE